MYKVKLFGMLCKMCYEDTDELYSHQNISNWMF